MSRRRRWLRPRGQQWKRGGQTWFWGYQSATQLQGNDTVVMRSISSAADVSSRNRSNDPQHGFELAWNLEWPAPRVSGFLGLEAAFNFMAAEIADSRPLVGNATQISDAFQLD